MPRVTCRCGEKLKVHADRPERIECPRCGARIRLRHREAPPERGGETGDGYVRFHCPCGRRLKVLARDRPVAGKCPDCGRTVPVPPSAGSAPPSGSAGESASSDPNARTEEMGSDDLARLERWTARHLSQSSRPRDPGPATPAFVPVGPGAELGAQPGAIIPATVPPSVLKFEAGLRVCPRCQKPVHLGTSVCRECGTPVPRR